MNSISWFLYLAGVSGSIGSAAAPLFVFSTIGAALATIGGVFVHAGDYSWITPEQKAWWEARRAQCATAAKTLWRVAAVLLALIVLTPSQSTMYAIAASQVGEQVVRSEAVQGIANDATKALQIWIKKQIDPDKKS